MLPSVPGWPPPRPANRPVGLPPLRPANSVLDDAAREVIGEAPSAEMLLKSIGSALLEVSIGPLAAEGQPLFGGNAE